MVVAAAQDLTGYAGEHVVLTSAHFPMGLVRLIMLGLVVVGGGGGGGWAWRACVRACVRACGGARTPLCPISAGRTRSAAAPGKPSQERRRPEKTRERWLTLVYFSRIYVKVSVCAHSWWARRLVLLWSCSNPFFFWPSCYGLAAARRRGEPIWGAGEQKRGLELFDRFGRRSDARKCACMQSQSQVVAALGKPGTKMVGSTGWVWSGPRRSSWKHLRGGWRQAGLAVGMVCLSASLCCPSGALVVLLPAVPAGCGLAPEGQAGSTCAPQE